LLNPARNIIYIHNIVVLALYPKRGRFREPPTQEDTPLFAGPKNDVSFEIDGKVVVFVEHQSTPNPNITLRMLAYTVETYKPIRSADDIYRPVPVKLPYPEYYVFYNGTRDVPVEDTVRLSDLFEPRDDGKPHALDLTVGIYNINTNYESELLQRSKTLAQYSAFVESVRKYEKTHKRDAAIKRAINECMKRGMEVMDMLYRELDKDTIKRLYREAGVIKGREEGIGIGAKRALLQTAAAMKNKGMDTNTIAEITGLTVDDILRIE